MNKFLTTTFFGFFLSLNTYGEDGSPLNPALNIHQNQIMEIPEEVFVNHIFSYLELDELQPARETKFRNYFTETYYQSYVKNHILTYQEIPLGDYPEYLNSYRGFAFFVHKLKSTKITNLKQFLKPSATFIELLQITFKEPKVYFLRGKLREAVGENQQAWEFYKLADTLHYPKSGERICTALYYGSLGQDQRTKEERYKELKTRASEGDTIAQQHISLAIYEGKFKYAQQSNEERWEKLLKREQLGNQQAKDLIDTAIFEGKFVYAQQSNEERWEALTIRDRQGNLKAAS